MFKIYWEACQSLGTGFVDTHEAVFLVDGKVDQHTARRHHRVHFINVGTVGGCTEGHRIYHPYSLEVLLLTLFLFLCRFLMLYYTVNFTF